MAFVANAETIAREAMNGIDSGLSNKYSSVVRFLASHPDAASTMRGKSAPPVGSADYVRKQALAFSQSREARAPKPPGTIPDEIEAARDKCARKDAINAADTLCNS